MNLDRTTYPGHAFKCVVVIILLFAAGGINAYFSKPDISLPRKNLSEFPRMIGNWTAGAEHKIDNQSMKILQVDDYLMRDYRNTEGERISLYIGYFKSQREGKGIHSPRQCLPGAGWLPVNVSVHRLTLPNHKPDTVSINKYIMGKGSEQQLYLFWYQGRGRIYESEYWNKIFLIWDGLTQKRTDGALIRIHSRFSNDDNTIFSKQINFIDLMAPILNDYIPN
jgi:EpsI family protein